MTYTLAVLIAIDQLANALLLGAPDETLSSRAHRAWRDGKWFGVVFRPAINLLFFWQLGGLRGRSAAPPVFKKLPSHAP